MLLTLLGTGAAPTPSTGITVFWIKENGTWKRCLAHFKQNNNWEQVLPYIKVSGDWE